MNRKVILLSALVIVTVILAAFYYLYRKPNITARAIDYSLKATQLIHEFEKDENTANARYLDKLLAVNGEVKDVVKKDSILTIFLGDDGSMSSVSCSLSYEEMDGGKNIKQGDRVMIKGICTGMLLDVILINCEIIPNSQKP